MSLEAIKPIKKTGEECLYTEDLDLDIKLKDFWRWNCSDILNNTMRGVFAEFLVASDLGILSENRIEWDAYDLITEDGIKIEVKSSAYLQSWKQNKLSSIKFDIRPTQGWDSKDNKMDNEIKRQSDVYVFCLLSHKDKDTVDPLNLDQWEFYVLDTETINKRLGSQKTISLKPLLNLNPIRANYGSIRDAVNSVIFL